MKIGNSNVSGKQIREERRVKKQAEAVDGDYMHLERLFDNASDDEIYHNAAGELDAQPDIGTGLQNPESDNRTPEKNKSDVEQAKPAEATKVNWNGGIIGTMLGCITLGVLGAAAEHTLS